MLKLKPSNRHIPLDMKKHPQIQKKIHAITPILLSVLFIGWSTSVQAQTQADIDLCSYFSLIGKKNTELRDSGRSREQVISYNGLYTSENRNKSPIYQEYLTAQVEQIFSDDYLKLSPTQIQKKLYDDCIDIFRRAEQSKPR